jgi:heat shock protein HtpX
MNIFKTVLLLVLLAALLMWIGGLVGGQNGVIIAFVLSLVINGVSYWFSDRIVIAMYGAKQLSAGEFPELRGIVGELASRAGIPCPSIYMVNMPVPNAFATGRDPNHAAVCVTKGIVDMLDREEIKGVISHELAHIKNRDTLIMTVTATLASTVMMLANMARWAAIFGGSSRDRRGSGDLIGLLAISIIGPIAALLVQMAISRSREYGADSRGAHISGNPEGLASALEKLSMTAKKYKFDVAPQTAHLFIVSPLHGNMLATLFSTHPPLEERVKRLRGMAAEGIR